MNAIGKIMSVHTTQIYGKCIIFLLIVLLFITTVKIITTYDSNYYILILNFPSIDLHKLFTIVYVGKHV